MLGQFDSWLIAITSLPTDDAEGHAVDHAEIEEQKLDHAEVLLGQAERVLDEQLSRFDTLDTKASIILGLNGVIIAILAERVLDTVKALGMARVPLLIAALAIVAATLLAFRAYWPARYATVPSLTRMREQYFTWESDELRYLVFCWIEQATRFNGCQLIVKVAYLKASLFCLVMGLVVTLVAMFIS
jgi:hypothetical protein